MKKVIIVPQKLLRDLLHHYEKKADKHRKLAKQAVAKELDPSNDSFQWGYYLGRSRVYQNLLKNGFCGTLGKNGIKYAS